MRVIETHVEQMGPTRVRVITTLEVDADEAVAGDELPRIGEGPTGTAIPDQIVRCLIDHAPASVALAEIQAAVGGNTRTVNRQAWTLAANAPDLQHRLRGWVVNVGRGRYALSPAALASLGHRD